jgi:hypothetical protein
MSKLLELTNARRFRSNVEGLLTELRARGENPTIHQALRSVAQQRRNVTRGVSQTQNSQHIAGADGLSRAADVVDERLLWGASERFWLIIGAYAFRNNFGWGGLFGRRRLAQQNLIIDKIIECEEADWPEATDPVYRGANTLRGWDPAHVQMPDNWPASRRVPPVSASGAAVGAVGRGIAEVGAGAAGSVGLGNRRP